MQRRLHHQGHLAWPSFKESPPDCLPQTMKTLDYCRSLPLSKSRIHTDFLCELYHTLMGEFLIFQPPLCFGFQERVGSAAQGLHAGSDLGPHPPPTASNTTPVLVTVSVLSNSASHRDLTAGTMTLHSVHFNFQSQSPPTLLILGCCSPALCHSSGTKFLHLYSRCSCST